MRSQLTACLGERLARGSTDECVERYALSTSRVTRMGDKCEARVATERPTIAGTTVLG
jgi:hypothetical protein